MFSFKKGFTLIELLIVIVIIGILAGIVFGVVYGNATNKAYDATKQQAISDLQSALGVYYTDNESTYPDSATAAALKTTLTDTTGGKTAYIKSTFNVEGLTYTHLTDPAEGYTLEFTLKNQNQTGDNITGTAPAKKYSVTVQD